MSCEEIQILGFSTRKDANAMELVWFLLLGLLLEFEIKGRKVSN